MTSQAYTPAYNAQAIPCLICGEPLVVRLAKGRRSHKPFVMLLCARDGRHFRAFINDQAYVHQVLARLEGQIGTERTKDGAELDSGPAHISGTNLEQGTQAIPHEAKES